MKRHLARIVTALTVVGMAAACSLGPIGETDGEREDEEAAIIADQNYQGVRSAALGAHTATFHAEFVASDGSTSWRYDGTFQVDESGAIIRRDLAMEGLPQNVDPGDVTVIRSGDTQYMIGEAVGAAACLIFPSDVDLGESFLTPDSFLSPIHLPDRVLDRGGEETVAGQEGRVYSFEEASLGDFTKATGTIIQHPDGGVLRFSFKGDTIEDKLLEGVPGTLTWEYAVTALGPGGPVSAPAECAINLPLMADATNVARLPGLIRYDTPSALGDVTAFYEQALAAEGWGVLEFPQIREDVVVLTYAKGGEILSVSAQGEDGTTHVQLFVEDR